MKHKLVFWFNEVDKDDIPRVGGKGANLGEMIQAGIPIPNGFIVSSYAYFQFLEENKLKPKIKEKLEGLDVENPVKLHQASQAVKKMILGGRINESLAKIIIEYYESLDTKKAGKLKKILDFGKKHPLVAVRSSATAEDLPDASFAGQQSTFLNVQGEASLIEAVRECWASLFEERAIYYRATKKFDHFKVGIAVPVQKMVQSEKSGIMFTIDPLTNNKKVVVIDAIYGLGELIVQGAVTPDHYEVEKKSLKILKKFLSFQNRKMIKAHVENKIVNLTKSEGGRQKISDSEIKKLAELGRRVEHHYFFPQDLEWAIEGKNVYIVQSRPITTIKNIDKALSGSKELEKDLLKMKIILKGASASPGIASGECRILKSPKEIDKVKIGDILVAGMTNPDYVPAMKKAVAIITDHGGRTSHAAIVSRELGIPCIVGTETATKSLKNNQIVTVDGKGGIVYEGGLSKFQIPNHKSQINPNFQIPNLNNNLKTATKVYVNLAEPELAADIAKRNVDGVGLLRAEFIMAQIGVHPRKMIERGLKKEFINILSDNILKFCEPFSPRPVIYRATDFKTNEYRNLKGGKTYEPQEENPLIGFRGCYRYIKDEAVFEMEIAAIKQVREKHGFTNLSMMIPFVRTVDELKKVKSILIANGLSRAGSFNLYLMVEIPSNVILIDDFIDCGIDGISIGSNDLTMLILGVDRDNSTVAPEFDERNPAVLWALEKVIKACAKRHVTSSICGQAPSIYPEITEKLVEWGITSVSITPDMIEKTREIIYEAEKDLISK